MASVGAGPGRRPPCSSLDPTTSPIASSSLPSSRSPYTRSSPTRVSSATAWSGRHEAAGRAKTEQVVLEFLYKVTELILQSRVNLQAEPSLERGTRRSRFNLDIEEIPFLRESMAAWRERVQLPLTIDIFLERSERRPAILVERWSVEYAGEPHPSRSSSSSLESHASSSKTATTVATATATATGGTGGTRDVIQQLKEVCKKISVLLRALYSFMRQLPAHVMVRQAFATSLSYKVYSSAINEPANSNSSSIASSNAVWNHLAGTPLDFEPDVAVDRYSFLPVVTPFGFLKLSTIYRRHCDLSLQANEPASILEENCIITDYVPSSPQPQGLDGVTSVVDVDGVGALCNVSSSSLSSEDLHSQSVTRSSGTSLIRRRSDPTQRTRDDDEEDDEVTNKNNSSMDEATSQHRHSSMSQPMAIPQSRMIPAQGYDDQSGENATGSSKAQEQPPHAHSYGDPATVRSMGTNPNVAAAPYGYGNVAINQEDNSSRWSNSANLNMGSHSSHSSGIGAMLESSPRSLTTPPLHPNSLHTTRSSRTSLPKRSSFENFLLETRVSGSADPNPNATATAPGNANLHESDSNGVRGSDTGHTVGTDAFEGVATGKVCMHGTSLDDNDPMTRVGLSSSPYMTPPFSYASHTQSPGGAGNSHGLKIPQSTDPDSFLHHGPTTISGKLSAAPPPFFSSSPPFRVNPSEFLSTSPAVTTGALISTSKRQDAQALLVAKSSRNYVHSSNALELSRRLERRHQREDVAATDCKRQSRRQARPRGFSADYDGSSRVWGVSPENGDPFGFQLARRDSGSDNSSDGGAHVTSLGFHGDGCGEQERPGEGTPRKRSDRANSLVVVQARYATDSAVESTIGELDALLLPFAIGDVSDSTPTSSTAVATTTTTSSTTEASMASESSSRSSHGLTLDRLQMTLETATVGNFLAQIKSAPKLHLRESQSRSGGCSLLMPTTASPLHPAKSSSSESVSASDHMALFDEELESFRLLRDELTGALS